MARLPRDGSRVGLDAIRAKELRRVMLHRYGKALPDDDAGREDLALVLRHLAHLNSGFRRMENFCDLFAPWLEPRERQRLLDKAAKSRPPRLTADRLAAILGITIEERTRLGLTTIGAVDCLKDERKLKRREQARIRQTRRRRRQGRQDRAHYLAVSLSKASPWKAEGVSRATWYRRRQQPATEAT